LIDDRPNLAELERRYVQLILSETDGNKSRAAEILGIDRRTIYRYLEPIGEKVSEPDGAPSFGGLSSTNTVDIFFY
jgi:DNA-binding NtrC family response regulator